MSQVVSWTEHEGMANRSSPRKSPPLPLLQTKASDLELELESDAFLPNVSRSDTTPRRSPTNTPRRSPTNINGDTHHSSRPRHQLRYVSIIFILIAILSMAKDSQHLIHNNKSLVLGNKLPIYSILPKKIYSVIGLESSGTQFVSKIIEEATMTGPYREGSRPCHETCTDDTIECHAMQQISKLHPCRENADVQVQHFSLPWGGTCHEHPNPPVVDVVLPHQCTRDHTDKTEIEQCNAMASSLWGFELNGKPIRYPMRYQLDITAHKRWYDAQGVEQVFIIVIRDNTISYAARHNHCNFTQNRKDEEEVGTELIVDAINTFILKDDDEKVTPTSFKHWLAKQYQLNNDGRRILSALPARDNVVVVSYESLVKLGGTYVKMLYDTLGIESDVIPDIKNSNTKYLNSTWS